MSRDSVLTRGRTAALVGFSDTCVIRRQTGSTVDPVSAVETPAYQTVYSGPCRLKIAQALADQHEVAEDRTLLLRLEAQLPISVVGLKVRDELSVTASPHDGDLVGRVFLIRDLMHETDATARRVQVVERTD